MSDDQIAKDIVRASLAHVPFDGWHMTSLQMGASDCGLGESDVTRLFPQGVPDAISLYAQIADEDMVAAFHALEEMPERTPAKIKALIMARLSLAQAHKETVSKTVSYLASPQQAPLASKLLYNTVDVMWRAAGDDATDSSFYSKRATLAAVYSATLFAFLSDDSPDLTKTEAFLDRRLQNVAQIPKITKPARSALEGAAGLASQFLSRLATGRHSR